eukprot:gene22854-29028_t
MSSATLLFLLIFGTLFFLCNENWSSAQAFYWTVVTMTTVGYGDLTTKKESSRGFTIVFIVLCLVTYATSIQNLREMYLLSLSIPLSDRDSSGGGGPGDLSGSLNGATRNMARRRGEHEMSNQAAGGGAGRDGESSPRETFNPLDGNSGNKSNVPPHSESESVDAVLCLLSLLEDRARSSDATTAQLTGGLRKDLAVLTEDLIHHIALYKDQSSSRNASKSNTSNINNEEDDEEQDRAVHEGSGEGGDSSALISKV